MKLTKRQRELTARALIDYCGASGKISDFTRSARICELIGASQAAAILEDRRDIFRRLKRVSLAEIAKGPDNKFFVKEKVRPGIDEC